jgi:hypothetical protein
MAGINKKKKSRITIRWVDQLGRMGIPVSQEYCMKFIPRERETWGDYICDG